MGGKTSTSFKPGWKGGPGRKPIPKDVVELARAHTVEAITTQVEIMRDASAPAAARVTAANAVLDRAWGKPAQTINANVTRTDVRQLSEAELDAAIANAVGRTSAVSGEAPPAAGSIKPH